jgi:hypothetical protein
VWSRQLTTANQRRTQPHSSMLDPYQSSPLHGHTTACSVERGKPSNARKDLGVFAVGVAAAAPSPQNAHKHLWLHVLYAMDPSKARAHPSMLVTKPPPIQLQRSSAVAATLTKVDFPPKSNQSKFPAVLGHVRNGRDTFHHVLGHVRNGRDTFKCPLLNSILLHKIRLSVRIRLRLHIFTTQ